MVNNKHWIILTDFSSRHLGMLEPLGQAILKVIEVNAAV